jgi:hypothetical protein
MTFLYIVELLFHKALLYSIVQFLQLLIQVWNKEMSHFVTDTHLERTSTLDCVQFANIRQTDYARLVCAVVCHVQCTAR